MTETEKINLILENNSMSFKRFLELEISRWLNSKKRKWQNTGLRYYDGDHEIYKEHRMIIGENGKLEIAKNLPNNHIVDNQYKKSVDKKTNYISGLPLAIETGSQSYAQVLNEVFNDAFRRTFKRTVRGSLNCGIAWIYPYIDEDKIKFKSFSGNEVMPFWKDDEHTELDLAVRIYEIEVYEGDVWKTVLKTEVYGVNGIDYYTYHNGALIPEQNAHRDYLTLNNNGELIGYNWEKIPLVAFKYTDTETPMIRNLKCLQDGINRQLTKLANEMEEDSRNNIFVLKDYNNQPLDEFRRNINTYGAVKINPGADGTGGLEQLTQTVDVASYKETVELFKKALIDNANSFDSKDDRLGNNPNEMNIQSMYADIDIDANGMENEYKAGFEKLLWFVNKLLAASGRGNFENEEVQVVFNRDLPMNESTIIDNCQKSVGILSNRKIISMHPWTANADEELEQIANEETEAQNNANPYRDSFTEGNKKNIEG